MEEGYSLVSFYYCQSCRLRRHPIANALLSALIRFLWNLQQTLKCDLLKNLKYCVKAIRNKKDKSSSHKLCHEENLDAPIGKVLYRNKILNVKMETKMSQRKIFSIFIIAWQ